MSLTKKSSGISWQFSDQNDGSFYVEDANHLPILYFPLMNSKGMKYFITPVLKGVGSVDKVVKWLTYIIKSIK